MTTQQDLLNKLIISHHLEGAGVGTNIEKVPHCILLRDWVSDNKGTFYFVIMSIKMAMVMTIYIRFGALIGFHFFMFCTTNCNVYIM